MKGHGKSIFAVALALVLALSLVPQTVYPVVINSYFWRSKMGDADAIFVGGLDGTVKRYVLKTDVLPKGLSWNKTFDRLEMNNFHGRFIKVDYTLEIDDEFLPILYYAWHPKIDIYITGDNSLIMTEPGAPLSCLGGAVLNGPPEASLTLKTDSGVAIDLVPAKNVRSLVVRNIDLNIEVTSPLGMAVNGPSLPFNSGMELRGDANVKINAQQDFGEGTEFTVIPMKVDMYDRATLDIDVQAVHSVTALSGVGQLYLNGTGHVRMSLVGGSNTTVKKSIVGASDTDRGENFNKYSVSGAWGLFDSSPSSYYIKEFTASTKPNQVEGSRATIPAGNGGTAIEPINLSKYVQGGVTPYSFAQLSGPAWVNISREGIVTGTRPDDKSAVATVSGYQVKDQLGRVVYDQVTVGEVINTGDEVPGIQLSSVDPEVVTVPAGGNARFRVEVTGSGNLSKNILWSIEGHNDQEGTTISSTGSLVVSAKETASTITVRATSEAEPKKSVTATVTVEAKPQQMYTISVVNGTATMEKAEAGKTVGISAHVVEGKVFDKWISSSGVVFADAEKSETTFAMPAGDVSIAATYKNQAVKRYTVTVVGGSSDPVEALAGEAVVITAEKKKDMLFREWVSEDEIEIAVLDVGVGGFIMPAHNVTIEAHFSEIKDLGKPEPVVLKDDKVERRGEFIHVQARQFEALGAQFGWDGTARVATFTVGETVVKITIDSGEANVNGVRTNMPAPAFIRDGRTYIPIRFVSEQLGWGVHWRQGDIVTISLP